MNEHIGMIQLLQLQPGVHAVHAKNAALLQHCCRLLQDVSAHPSHATPLDSATNAKRMITWRPRHVKDLMLICDGHRQTCAVGAMEDGHVQFFAPVTGASAMLPPGDGTTVLLCHLTCDEVDGGWHPVLLAYDMYTESTFAEPLPMRERYDSLLQRRAEVEGVALGAATVRVQWLGAAESYDKLCALELPHEKAGIVAFDGDAYYERVVGFRG